ncbi:MAG: acyl-ACP thioesterase [Rhodothermaceae bacterium]|nr:MAG: acyl-ACP thioesterase [Bacteroidota bacterium]GIV61675.1 MAG: acyl-ACP thioesterase [Rhodothermaceae bacterium]
MNRTDTLWHETFRVRSYEVEPNGRASIQSLCRYFEEVASNHARALGFSMEQLAEHNLTWVLNRLRVEIDDFPRWRDTVRVTTWPSGHDGLYARREYLLHDEDGSERARATSGWVMIDLARRRPTRLPAFIQEMHFPRQDRAVDDDFRRLRPPTGRFDRHRTFHVRYSDLDLNGHVNNVHYVEWAVETLEPAFLASHRMTSLEVDFRAETYYDARVRAETAPDDSTEVGFWHRLLREPDGAVVAVARTRWLPLAGG